MALFYINAWKDPQHDPHPCWSANVVAETVEEGYLIGKDRFEAENPALDVEDYTLTATGDTVVKSIST